MDIDKTLKFERERPIALMTRMWKIAAVKAAETNLAGTKWS